MSADYPKESIKDSKTVPGNKLYIGPVIDSGIEGRQAEPSIGTYKTKKM